MIDFSELVKDKRIVIVGPADSIDNSEQGELIDSYDLVVRVNLSIPVPIEKRHDQGSRTDIYYTCLNAETPTARSVYDEKIMKMSGAKVVVFPLPLVAPFLYDFMRHGARINSILPLRTIENEWFFDIQKKLGGSRPNTGFLAILDLLSFEIKELYITGFTFFQTEYSSNYKHDVNWRKSVEIAGYHNFENDLSLMKKIYKSDKRIVVDNKLKNILQFSEN